MKASIARTILILLSLPALGIAQHSSPQITAEEIRTHIQYLASDQLEGRASGTPGNDAAAEYIVNQLKEYGLLPAGDQGSYYQHFDFISKVKLGENNAMSIEGPNGTGGRQTLLVDKDFRPFAFTSDTTVTASLVFAGYGISALSEHYDDYEGIDVAGKIVLVLRYSPEGADPHGRLNMYSSFRNKARLARERGAVGLIMVTGPADDPDDDLIRLAFDQAFASSGIPAVCVKRAVFEPFFASHGWTLQAVQDSIKATGRGVSIPLPDVRISMTTDVVQVHATTANVIGYLPGTDPAVKDQVIVLGAHFDHLGWGGPGSGSLQPDTVAIHHGADDNASGTAGLLELAQAFAADPKHSRHTLMFTFFSGEELGTLGSAYYVNHPFFPLSSTVAMINMDMVGRLEKKSLTVYGTGTSSSWGSIVEGENKDSLFTLKLIPDGYGPSDHSQFYSKDIPVLFFFTGTHNDYHKPSDTWDKINYPGEEKVVQYVRNIARDIDDEKSRPDFVRVASSAPSGGGDRRSFRVTLGIIPDYAEETVGLKISGIRPGGPAEKAGLHAGDVIVKMSGKKVMNIYDYMGVLGELNQGDKVEVVVLRDGKTITVTAEMTKRK
jgi:aminopeptidase YwaD